MPAESTNPMLDFGYTREEILAHREAWLKDLESGEYPQGRGALVITSPVDGSKTYCCLGVACETARKSGLNVNVSVETLGVPSSPHIVTYYDTADGVLPTSVRRWLGLFDMNPIVDGHCLSAWNDGYSGNSVGVSLISIAAMLRTEWNMPKAELSPGDEQLLGPTPENPENPEDS